MARKKKVDTADVKHALDIMLADTPEGHVFALSALPEPLRSVLENMSALGATFGTKVVLRVKGNDGRYTNNYVVFTAAKYAPKSVRRNSRRKSVRRNSRRVAARKRRRTSRNR